MADNVQSFVNRIAITAVLHILTPPSIRLLQARHNTPNVAPAPILKRDACKQQINAYSLAIFWVR